MPIVGESDDFESRYMDRLRVLLGEHGIHIGYGKDRAVLDTGLHLYVRREKIEVSQSRVWFQAKGLRASTYTADQYADGDSVPVKVETDHLRFWYGAPEPVYLVVYLESVGVFLAEDVRDVVDRQWPRGTFYQAVPKAQRTVTVRMPADRRLDASAFEGMLRHRSMRIDGPAFRGRPLGHRYDPLRSCIETCDPDLFSRLVRALVNAHQFEEMAPEQGTDHLTVLTGIVHQTMSWQSPAFTEFGFSGSGPGQTLRSEPPDFSVQGHVLLLVDSQPDRTDFTQDEQELLHHALGADSEAMLNDDSLRELGVSPDLDASQPLVLCNSPELSRSGGLWRSTLREELGPAGPAVDLAGLESVTSLTLVATLVYLEFAQELAWRYLNYQ